MQASCEGWLQASSWDAEDLGTLYLGDRMQLPSTECLLIHGMDKKAISYTIIVPFSNQNIEVLSTEFKVKIFILAFDNGYFGFHFSNGIIVVFLLLQSKSIY